MQILLHIIVRILRLSCNNKQNGIVIKNLMVYYIDKRKRTRAMDDYYEYRLLTEADELEEKEPEDEAKSGCGVLIMMLIALLWLIIKLIG